MTKVIPAITALESEAFAACEGLSWAKSKAFQNIVVETDLEILGGGICAKKS